MPKHVTWATMSWSLALLLAACSTLNQPDSSAVLRQAEQAMGGAGLKSVQFTTQGGGGTFG